MGFLEVVSVSMAKIVLFSRTLASFSSSFVLVTSLYIFSDLSAFRANSVARVLNSNSRKSSNAFCLSILSSLKSLICSFTATEVSMAARSRLRATISLLLERGLPLIP